MSEQPHDHLGDAERAAIEALEAEGIGDEQVEAAPDDSTATEATEPEAPETGTSTEASDGDEGSDFIPRADLEALLEGLGEEERDRVTSAYKSLQRASTKHNQKLASIARAFEGVDLEQVQEAYGFVESLKNDRQFAEQVHKELAAALEIQGATPEAASAEADRQVRAAQAAPSPGYSEEDLVKWGVDPDNPLVREIEDMRNWRASEELRRQQEAEERALAAQRDELIREIEHQDAGLRQKYANWKQDELDEYMDATYKLATAFGGDLESADQYLSGLRETWRSDYALEKLNIPEGVRPLPTGTSHGDQPTEIRNLKDAHKEALRRLMSGEFSE